MIHEQQFYNVLQNISLGNANNTLWCQTANNSSNIGLWYFPNGTQVPLFAGNFGDEGAPIPIFSKRFKGQIALAINGRELSGYEGLYSCNISDEKEVSQILVVGIYRYQTYYSNGL